MQQNLEEIYVEGSIRRIRPRKAKGAQAEGDVRDRLSVDFDLYGAAGNGVASHRPGTYIRLVL